MEEQGSIIYVGGFEMPDRNAAAHRVLNNGKILRELGYKVIYIGISHQTQCLDKIEFDGFICWSIPYPQNKKQWFTYLTSIDVLKQVIDKMEDVKGIIFYNYQSVALFKGLNLCKKIGIWSIVDVTEWYLASPKNPIFFVIKQFDTSARMRILNKKADGIIAISTFLYDYYNKDEKRNVVQIPPLVDKSEKKWVGQVERQENDTVNLIYAGSTSDLKDNLLIVMKSICSFDSKIKMSIVGVEKEALISMLSDSKLETFIENNVQVFGRISHRECLKKIQESDFQIFIRPDNLVTKAGFPTKLGESFACGTPVITNLSSNISDYLIEGRNGFIVEKMTVDGIQSMMGNIIKLRNNDILEMKQFCKNMDIFDYHSFICKMDELLSNIEC